MNVQVSAEHFMQVMDPTGHTTVTWNPDSVSSVRDARTEFQRLIREGYQAFKMKSVRENGVITEEKDVRITEFDASVGRVMMIPQLVGG